jgi:hypothetical protein
MSKFGLSPLLTFMYVVAVIAAPTLSIAFRNQSDADVLHVMTALGAFIILYSWPRPITLDHEGVKQKTFFFRQKFIPWPEVDSISHEFHNSNTTVWGGDVTVVHGWLHDRKEEFVDEVEKRTGRRLVTGGV